MSIAARLAALEAEPVNLDHLGPPVASDEPLTCIHTLAGLCPDCQLEYDEDPMSWIEYGQHPQGIANWEALRKWIAAGYGLSEPRAEPDPELPF